MTIAVLLACLATPNLDACLKSVFHGPGPKVVLQERPHVDPWPHVVIFKLGDDGVCCQRTRYRDGTITIACVG